ncbi:MAG TPA: D-alanyl-D-alanine carboxypeptidase/D-alanyl-D-alanine-endopeptidase [Rhodothermales bacterium]|nr:D-alanyl-D-alanine carboxypeptidase/D-alanyl-D-alanine-endopeptidase [Rhodothermales bacterium]
MVGSHSHPLRKRIPHRPPGFSSIHSALALICLLVLSHAASAQPATIHTRAQLSREIDEVLDADELSNAFAGVYVVDLSSGSVVYAHDAEKSFIPASNAKLYTSATALKLLGPDYRYRTDVFRDGPVVDGTIQGNLIVRGSGDPTIGAHFNDDDVTDITSTFRAWADTLRALGISQIDGDIIGDDDVFDDEPYGSGWSWDDLDYYYAVPISGLSFNENAVDFSIKGQRIGMPGIVSWEPLGTDYVEVTNSTVTIGAGNRIDEGYARAPGTNHIVLSSRVPAGRTDTESLSIDNPTLYFAHVLRASLVQSGISISGQAVDVDDLAIKPDYASPALRRLMTYASPPLLEIVEEMNKESNNFFAEQLIKTVAAEAPLPTDEYPVGSAEMGTAVERELLGGIGVDTLRVRLVDGSGLSRQDLVTPKSTVTLLSYLWNSRDRAIRDAYYDSLPIGGVDGTLDYRFRRGAARGNVHAKTGSLTGVSSLSGYVTTRGGTPLAFSIMVNHFTVETSTVRDAQDAIVELLARYGS